MLQEDQLVILLQELTSQMARAVVIHPDRVRVETTVGASMTILELSVDPEDMGRVIGREGRVATAMRTILRASAAQMNKRVTLEIIGT
jgi:predicted RNA-binding protein YlqC (UPF0109 family)